MIARKGWYAYELQIGPLVFFWKLEKTRNKFYWCKNRFDGSRELSWGRFEFFTDPYWRVGTK